MRHYGYYEGGILQEETNSKDIARKLMRGELQRTDTILDMHSGLWVTLEKQEDIMQIYSHMKKVSKNESFLKLWLSDANTYEEEDDDFDICPDRIILGFIPLWKYQQVFSGETLVYRFFAKLLKTYKRWRNNDSKDH